MNKLGCVVSPEGGGIGYIASFCISVEEVVVIPGNKSLGRKNNCSGHPQEGNGELFFRNYFRLWEYLGYCIMSGKMQQEIGV